MTDELTLQQVAELQVVLEGIRLPARRDELVQYAASQDPQAARELDRLPDREYASIDEVAEELLRVQPRAPAPVPLPKPESDRPPGGDDYVNPSPEPGAVRPSAPPGYSAPERVAAQTETVKKQERRQQAP